MKWMYIHLIRIVFISVLVGIAGCAPPRTDWSQLTSLRIYSNRSIPPGKTVETLSRKDIEQMNFIEADIGEARRFMSKAKSPRYAMYLWKGEQLAIATLDHEEERIIRLSNYGGFFWDLTTDTNYRLENVDDILEWHDFLGLSVDSIAH